MALNLLIVEKKKEHGVWYHLKSLRKKKKRQSKSKVWKEKEVIKTRGNKIKQMIQKQVFENINKMDKLLDEEKEHKSAMVRKKGEFITIDFSDIKEIIREYSE